VFYCFILKYNIVDEYYTSYVEQPLTKRSMRDLYQYPYLKLLVLSHT